MNKFLGVLIIGLVLTSCNGNSNTRNSNNSKSSYTIISHDDFTSSIPTEKIVVRTNYTPRTPLDSELLTKSLDDLIIMKYDEKWKKYEKELLEYWEKHNEPKPIDMDELDFEALYEGGLKYVADTTKLAKAYVIDRFHAFELDNSERVRKVIDRRDANERKMNERKAMETWSEYMK